MGLGSPGAQSAFVVALPERHTVRAQDVVCGYGVAGFGLAYLPGDVAQHHIAKKRLVWVLKDWCQPYTGYHLYFPKSPPTFRGVFAIGGGASVSSLNSDTDHVHPSRAPSNASFRIARACT
jgi:hypothetical protein